MKFMSIVLVILVFLCADLTAGEGFADDRGGEGGRVIRVTNLKCKGAGSLRAAIKQHGPRIVIFEVGGVIDLEKWSLHIKDPFITIAGQTAPSPGITIIRGGINILTHDVVIKHIRVRPGDVNKPKRSGWECDGISTDGPVYNVIVDHCSITWATDENLSASGPRTEGPQATSRNITFSNCIVAEGLSNATHPLGEHSKGSLIHDFCRNIAIVGNLYAHNTKRNPYFKAFTTGVIVNNVIYNPGKYAIQLDYVPKEWKKSKVKPKNARVAIVGNILIHGTDTKKNLALVSRRGDAYLKDNLAFNIDGKPAPLTSGKINQLSEKPLWPEGLKPLPATDVVDFVIKHVGARPKDRDVTDSRIISEFLERKGHIIDSQEDVGGYPRRKIVIRKLDIPQKGINTWIKRIAKELE